MVSASNPVSVVHTLDADSDLRLRSERLGGSSKPESSKALKESMKMESPTTDKHYAMEIVWSNVIKFVILHSLGFMALFTIFEVDVRTLVFSFVCYIYSGLGITAGAHRLWTHRSYKARLPLRIFLMVANAMAMEDSIFLWVRDHRTHHKHSETDADPYNSDRGFFFAHMGWLMVRKHPDVIEAGRKIDLSDVRSDPVVWFQHRHYMPLCLFFCLGLPTLLPWIFWNEGLWVSYLWSVFRYLFVLHNTWLVNSAAHMWGSKPYDINISPSKNFVVSAGALGEGFHNYHHTFPQDYSTSEHRYTFNVTTLFIDAMALIGQAYNRKTISNDVVKARINRTGPGTARIDHRDYDKTF